ncbi:MAG: fumarylacetoacetate hydrolase family protein [Acetobacteraceae bacterium]
MKLARIACGGGPVVAVGFLGGRAPGALPVEGGERVADAMLLAPLPNPPHGVLCVGKNYRAHAHEFSQSGYDNKGAAAMPERPIIFAKPASAISDPEAAIPLWPGLNVAIDYEAELAVVIGRGGRCIPHAEAMAHVFGCTIINDVTARDVQRRQNANTRDLIFDVPELIATISRSMALLPGDVIATGTPEGVGIGRLRNTVRRMTVDGGAAIERRVVGTM